MKTKTLDTDHDYVIRFGTNGPDPGDDFVRRWMHEDVAGDAAFFRANPGIDIRVRTICERERIGFKLPSDAVAYVLKSEVGLEIYFVR